MSMTRATGLVVAAATMALATTLTGCTGAPQEPLVTATPTSAQETCS